MLLDCKIKAAAGKWRAALFGFHLWYSWQNRNLEGFFFLSWNVEEPHLGWCGDNICFSEKGSWFNNLRKWVREGGVCCNVITCQNKLGGEVLPEGVRNPLNLTPTGCVGLVFCFVLFVGWNSFSLGPWQAAQFSVTSKHYFCSFVNSSGVNS